MTLPLLRLVPAPSDIRGLRGVRGSPSFGAMRVIDAHVHLYPPAVNADPAGWARDQGETHWEVLCTRVRKSGLPVQGFPTVDELLRSMDEADVERVVLQGWYWERQDNCRFQNRFFAEVQQAHPDRISACGTLTVREGEASALEELRWCRDAGFCGLGELSPHSQGFSMDDPAWHRILDEAGEARLAVCLHVTEPAGRAYPGRILTPLDGFLGLARAHPSTQFVLAHWGARLPQDPALGAEARALPNLAYDMAASPLLYDPAEVAATARASGVDTVLFGSDFPLHLYPRDPAATGMTAWCDTVLDSGLTAPELAAVLRENARRLYRLP